MLDGCTIQAYSTEVLELAHATTNYSTESNNRMQVSECKNTSERGVAFEQYCSYIIE